MVAQIYDNQIDSKKTSALVLILWLGLLLQNADAYASQEPTAAELIELQLEELVSMDIEVESAGKTQTKALDLPYAGFVVTEDDIQRYNITTVPDALRMVPGLQVEQIAGAEWAVSIRGSGGRFSRFVLVLLNGRALNNTIFSGVNWDEVNVTMNNIERIEVIRGPNANSWGANAVNGIINILTKSSSDIHQNKLRVAGNKDSKLSLDLFHSSRVSENWSMSLALNQEQLPGFSSINGSIVEDSSEIRKLNFQLNHKVIDSQFDINFGGLASEISSFWPAYLLPDINLITTLENKSAHFLQSSWSFEKNDSTTIRTRFSVDNIEKNSDVSDWHSENIQLDLDIQHRYDIHSLDFGINLRASQSDFIPVAGFPLEMNEESVEVDYSGIYFSGTFNFPDANVTSKLGARLDHNTLTGYEFQPSARFIWNASDRNRFWVAFSEAASIPSVAVNNAKWAYLDFIDGAEIDSPYPLAVVVTQKHELTNTRVNAKEFGFRHLWQDSNIDLAIFQFDYSDELSITNLGNPQFSTFPPTPESYLIQLTNFESTSSYTAQGVEVNYLAQITPRWRMQLALSHLDNENKIGTEALYSVRTDYQWSDNLQTTIWYRYSSGNELFQAEKFGVIDFNLNYKLSENVSVRYSARNYGEGKYEEGRREYFSAGTLLNSPSQQLLIDWTF